MEILERMECRDETEREKVCKLEKALFGLKLNPKRWNEKFTEVAQKIGLTVNSMESCLFTWRSNKKFLVLLLYLEDMLIASNDAVNLK